MSATETISVGDPLPKIANVTARDAYRVVVSWAEGKRAGEHTIIDLAPMILAYKIFRPLRDNVALFKSVHVSAGGSIIAWADDEALDLAASTVERLADEVMSAEDFKGFLDQVRWTFDRAAAELGISRRLVAYYAQGREIPRYIALACKYFAKAATSIEGDLENHGKKLSRSLEGRGTRQDKTQGAAPDNRIHRSAKSRLP
jgi:Protein of unknown function (DUF2442)